MKAQRREVPTLAVAQELEQLLERLAFKTAGTILPLVTEQQPQPQGGLIEASLAVTGVAAAIMALVPAALEPGSSARGWVLVCSVVVSALALYTSLWLLGRFVATAAKVPVRRWKGSSFGVDYVWALITNPAQSGPYFVLAINLGFLVLALFIAGVMTL